VNYHDIGLSIYKYDGDSLRASGLTCSLCKSSLVLDADENCLVCSRCGARSAITAERISGAQFTLYRQITATEAASIASERYQIDAEGIYWLICGTATTDTTGKATFSSNLIDRFGNYRVAETASAGTSGDGWMLPSESWASDRYDFTVDASTVSSTEISRTFIDYRYRDIVVNKIDQDTGAAVSDTTYKLYRWTDPDDPQACPLECGGDDASGTWTEIATSTTDTNGSHIFGGLTFGYYRISETVPRIDYAYASESGQIDTYYFSVDENKREQVQTWKNRAISLECHVNERTIAITSAGFRSLARQTVAYDNTASGSKEKYRYDVTFDNGNTNVRADQYSVVDTLSFNRYGIRLSDLYTPVVVNDSDGVYNIWYKTDLSDSDTVYSDLSANAPEAASTNKSTLDSSATDGLTLSDGTDRISTKGYRVWAQNVSCTARQHLSVDDLNLADGEHLTSLVLEFGSVEEHFTTTVPLSYLVYASDGLSNEREEIVIPDSATSHITRNYISTDSAGNSLAQPVGLWDDDTSSVQTRVIDTFAYGFGSTSSQHVAQTGDETPILLFLLIALGLISGVCGTALVVHRVRISKR
jgi:hypothetical protein